MDAPCPRVSARKLFWVIPGARGYNAAGFAPRDPIPPRVNRPPVGWYPPGIPTVVPGRRLSDPIEDEVPPPPPRVPHPAPPLDTDRRMLGEVRGRKEWNPDPSGGAGWRTWPWPSRD